MLKKIIELKTQVESIKSSHVIKLKKKKKAYGASGQAHLY